MSTQHHITKDILVYSETHGRYLAFRTLLDSGSDVSFISSYSLSRLGIGSTPCPPRTLGTSLSGGSVVATEYIWITWCRSGGAVTSQDLCYVHGSLNADFVFGRNVLSSSRIFSTDDFLGLLSPAPSAKDSAEARRQMETRKQDERNYIGNYMSTLTRNQQSHTPESHDSRKTGNYLGRSSSPELEEYETPNASNVGFLWQDSDVKRWEKTRQEKRRAEEGHVGRSVDTTYGRTVNSGSDPKAHYADPSFLSIHTAGDDWIDKL